MTSPQKQKGSEYERQIVRYLRDEGFTVDRTRAGWSDDRGEWVRYEDVQRLIIKGVFEIQYSMMGQS